MEQIEQAISKSLESLGLSAGDPSTASGLDFSMEHPGDDNHGDFSTNVAMMLWADRSKQNTLLGQSWKSTRELAEGIKQQLEKEIEKEENKGLIEKIEVAGPGFINFYLTENALVDQAQEVLIHGEAYGTNQSLKGKKVVVEYTDPNPFKEFHVGHLYSNLVGESIARLFEANGATVWRADFFGDVGMHVAKALWGIFSMEESGARSQGVSDIIKFLEEKPLKERIEYFGQAYATGATAYEEDEAAKEDMKQINFLVFKAAQEVVLPSFKKAAEVDYERFIKPSKYDYEEIKQLYRVGREWSLLYFETIYNRLGTKFDGYYPESLTGEYGYGMVMDGLSRGIFEKGEKGAIIFPGKKHGLHDRVFINSLGLPTYETKDFGLSTAKAADFAYDQSVIATGNEINEYFQVVLKALHLYKPELGDVTTHIGHGMVRLPEGKMSSRTGKIIRGEMVLDEAKERVLKLMTERKIDHIEEMAELISQAAIKYAFLRQGIGSDIAFDFETSLSFEGNSGPYLQYTVVRARSVLAKTERQYLVSGSEYWAFNAEETAILRWLYRYPEVVAEAAADYAPHVVATYLFELAQRFNSFYNKHSILEAETEEQKSFRLGLTAAVNQVLTNGLGLLGIKIPVKM